MNEEQIRRYAEKRVRMKQGFYYHLLAFILVNLLITMMRVMTEGIHWTLIFPFLPWSIGLIFHGFFTFVGGDPISFESKVQKEMERLKSQMK
ncbi:2TM domain-containing protein [Paenactinomyces guangxiensis]|uniref:2TM domain-containing protein n=1 Tax=Paenactinomyces guangxiensis TaxID=1490290 RepID=A0A7W1WUT6_9BACL|nr:2TM domain-containing protein [Paenactinomyces guangxiensis]MBA4496485.1 2TM domain-containing protein [Paenactinomyces guangxiensis]MBH8593589.1 2TM domain-containing protein [Paenactinomyces guangxiensis]